jgi:hypothetical protein
MSIEISRRRCFLAAVLPLAHFYSSLKGDAQLNELEFEFDKLAARIDTSGLSLSELEQFGRLFDEICLTPATTMEGLCVKARVGCWTVLGDFYSANKSTPGAQAAFSIMQDIIRIYHPELENPGSVQRLIEEIEQDRCSSTNTAI